MVHSHGDYVLAQCMIGPQWIVVGENHVEIEFSRINTEILDPVEIFGVEVDIEYHRAPLKI